MKTERGVYGKDDKFLFRKLSYWFRVSVHVWRSREHVTSLFGIQNNKDIHHLCGSLLLVRAKH